MAYVPRYIYDVFISYAHLDERTADGRPGWVSSFAAELDIALGQALGEPCHIWFDRDRLKPGFLLSEKIRYDLSRTAVLLRLESPSFWQSGYCMEESAWFESPDDSLDAMTFSTWSRRVRTELLPVSGMSWGNELVARFHEAGKRLSPEAAAQALASEIAMRLFEMEGTREPVYIPRPSADDEVSLEAWKGTTGELKASNYRFTPRTLAAENENQMREAIERARLAVMLVGTKASRSPIRERLEICREAQRPAIVWISPSAAKDTSPQQGEILKWLRENAGPFELLERTSVEKLKERMRGALSPAAASTLAARRSAAAEAPMAGSPLKLYLICAPRDRKQGAWKLKQYAETNGFEVLLPETAAPDATAFSLDHLQKARSADGVVLYYQSAARKWFEQQWRELCDDSLPWRSRAACLLSPPDKQKWVDDARGRGFGASPAKLLVTDEDSHAVMPFLDAMRAARGEAR